MFVTVAVCTWNRSALLDQTLAEMRKLEVPAGVEWELLVVNNNCTDNTDEIIARHAGALPIRRLFEPQPGLSNARNCAVAAASGDYILWTDDDVLVEPRWLAEYVSAFAQWPDAAFFGGPIQPWLEPPTPSWLEEVLPEVGGAFALRDLGAEPIACDTRQRCPYGANYAIRADLQRQHPYDAGFGYTEDRKIGGEELMVMWKMLDDHWTGQWIPGAKVRHFIPHDRQNVRYLRKYSRGWGMFYALLDNNNGIRIGFVRRCKMFVRAVEAECKSRLAWLFGRHRLWAKHLVQANFLWGKLRGCVKLTHPGQHGDMQHDVVMQLLVVLPL